MRQNLKSIELDKIDHAIINELCLNARTTTVEIGRRVGLTAPAVAGRITKLEETGIIMGYTALMNFDKLGLNLQAFISFKCRNKAHSIPGIIAGISAITESYTITGNSSMLLKVITGSREELSKIIMQLEEYGETNTSLILEGKVEITPLIKNLSV
jgi:Lrp/AsnC family leucine-responsive transcriptional regulator